MRAGTEGRSDFCTPFGADANMPQESNRRFGNPPIALR
jgi:hypothetical protein